MNYNEANYVISLITAPRAGGVALWAANASSVDDLAARAARLVESCSLDLIYASLPRWLDGSRSGECLVCPASHTGTAPPQKRCPSPDR